MRAGNESGRPLPIPVARDREECVFIVGAEASENG